MSIKVEVWGDYALFTRPEMKVERVSYDVITPSAARGILDSVFYHPGMQWCIDKIYVRSPIRFTNIRRNEVENKMSCKNIFDFLEGKDKKMYIATSECRQQRAAMVLKNVRYVIEAHFVMTDKANPSDNPGKFQEMMRRRLEKGQAFHQPCFGVREFPANCKLCEVLPPCPEELLGERDLGFMLLDMDYRDPRDIKPMFFRAVMKDGMIEVPPLNGQGVVK